MNSNKRMTKQESLEICIKMWDWLAEHPDANKLAAINELDLPITNITGCAACQYTQENSSRINFPTESTCVICPVWYKATGLTQGGCLDLKSPYRTWETARYGEIKDERTSAATRKVAAKQVANLARVELAKVLRKRDADKKRRSKSNG